MGMLNSEGGVGTGSDLSVYKSNRQSPSAIICRTVIWQTMKILLLAFLLQACSGPVPPKQIPGEEATINASDDEFLRLQREARQRPRRIIFNNDGDDGLYFPEGSAATAQNLLATRTLPLLGTQVDTIFYCTTQSFGAYSHRTEVTEQHVQDIPRKGFRNVTRELAQQGTDSLSIMVEYCRKEGIEIFSSVRMNDIHDGAGYASLGSEYKKRNPDYLFGTEKEPPPYGVWTGVDFGREEVRDHAFQILEELLKNYDIDGLELDFWRHPPFFKRHAWGQPVTPEELEGMTELLRRVRRAADAQGRQRGRPLLIAARVLESPEMNLDMGLDLVTWLQEDLIDLVIVGEVSLVPWEETIQLAHRFGVPVFPCLRRSMVEAYHGSLESLRAQALTAWKQGADGIYLFNIFPEETNPQVFSELGEPELLEGLDKLYSLDPVGGEGFKRYLPQFWKHHIQNLFSPASPLEIEVGKRYRIPIYLADQALGKKEAEAVPEVLLRLQAERLEEGDVLDLSVNGYPLEPTDRVGTEVHYPVVVGWLKTGYNLFQVHARGPSRWRLKDIVLEVSYPN